MTHSMDTAAKNELAEAYSEKGYVVWPQHLTEAQIGSLTEAWENLWNATDESENSDDVLYRNHDGQGRIADRLENVRHKSNVYRELCEESDIKSFAEQLLGGPCFVLKDKLITKAPQTSGYDPHQDFAYWSEIGLESDEVLSVAISLDHTSAEHGPLEICEALHHSRLPGAPGEELDVDPAVLEGSKRFAFVSKPGGVLFFHSLAPHFSAKNSATTSRRMFYITYALDKGGEDRVRSEYDARFERIQKFHRKAG